jgi:transposase
VLDTIWYVLRTGCAWRLAPNDLVPWHAEAMVHIAMTGLMLRRPTGQETRYRNNNRRRAARA